MEDCQHISTRLQYAAVSRHSVFILLIQDLWLLIECRFARVRSLADAH